MKTIYCFKDLQHTILIDHVRFNKTPNILLIKNDPGAIVQCQNVPLYLNNGKSLHPYSKIYWKAIPEEKIHYSRMTNAFCSAFKLDVQQTSINEMQWQ